MRRLKIIILGLICFPSLVSALTYSDCIDINDELVSGDSYFCINNLRYYKKEYTGPTSSYDIVLYDEDNFGIKYYQAKYDDDGNIVYSLYEPTSNQTDTLNYNNYKYGEATSLPKINGEKVKWQLKEIKKEGYGFTSTYEDPNGHQYISSSSFDYYKNQYLVFYQIPVKEIVPSITCNALEINVDEKVNCQVNLNKDTIYSSVSFKLTSNKLKFENIKLATNWSKEEIENGYIIKYKNTNNLLGDSENTENIVTFDVKYVDELKNKTNELIEINDFNYVNELGENEINSINYELVINSNEASTTTSSVLDETTTKKVEEEIENPKTGIMSLDIIIIVLLITLIIYIQYHKKLTVFKNK